MRFTRKDLEVFEVPGFADRMQLIADTIRPKLVQLGDLLHPQLSRLVHQELYTHVAQHARRTVNPPDETWVAFGPDKNGYKPYVHFELTVGLLGVQARIIAKPECRTRKQFATNILTFMQRLADLKGHKEMEDYSKRDQDLHPTPIAEWIPFLQEQSKRLKTTATSTVDIGINLPLSGDLSSHAIRAFERLVPFYFLGHDLPWQQSNNGNGFFS